MGLARRVRRAVDEVGEVAHPALGVERTRRRRRWRSVGDEGALESVAMGEDGCHVGAVREVIEREVFEDCAHAVDVMDEGLEERCH